VIGQDLMCVLQGGVTHAGGSTCMYTFVLVVEMSVKSGCAAATHHGSDKDGSRSHLGLSLVPVVMVKILRFDYTN
jgi:hypothetical protein